MQRIHVKPELRTPFPGDQRFWTDPKTGIVVPKRLQENFAWRINLQKKAENDEGMQQDLLAACAESQLFWINAFCMTFHQFDVDVSGNRAEAVFPHQPFITWEIQDDLLLEYEKCLKTGKDILNDKARDMGISWCCVNFMHWLMLFREDTTILEMSRNEDYVDKPGNMKALFQKHDYINERLPDWMRPPACFLGEENRTHMHWHNPIVNTTLDGESTTRHAARGDRRAVCLLDEFGAVQNGSAMRMASRDAALVRIVNSTSVPGSEYNIWRSDNTIKVFPIPYWEHPEKGKGRYIQQMKTGKWKIRSPWYDIEEKIRGPKYMATEVDREDIEPGLSFFDVENIDSHAAMYARYPRTVFDIKFRGTPGYDEVEHAIKHRALSLLSIRETNQGPLKWWGTLIDGRPDQRLHYIIGIDTGKGQEASNSVMSIKCLESGEKVGEWASASYPPYDFAPIVVAVAIWVGGSLPRKLPFLKWENNGPGWDLGKLLVKQFYYPFFYRHEAEGKTVNRRTQSYGFHTGRRSKYELLSAYDAALSNGTYINRSQIALDEARTYIHYANGGVGPAGMTQESVSAKATHGDRVMADALTVGDSECIRKKSRKRVIQKNSAGYRFQQHIRDSKKSGHRYSTKRKKFNFGVV